MPTTPGYRQGEFTSDGATDEGATVAALDAAAIAPVSVTRNFKLFVPGPVEMDETVRVAGSRRLPYMRTEEFSKLTLEVVEGLRLLLETGGEVALLTSSGTGAMEAAVSSLFGPSDRVLVVDGGTFGRRFRTLCEIHGIPHEAVDPGEGLDFDELARRVGRGFSGVLVAAHETSTGELLDVESLGRALKGHGALFVVDAVSTLLADSFRMDAWGVDATLFSTQKGLALPPGMAFVALNARAAERARRAPRRTLYFHLADYLADGLRGQTPYTVAVGLMLQLQARLSAVHAVGVASLVAETASRAAAFRAAIADLPVSLSARRPSNAITALRLDGSAPSAPWLVKELADRFGYYVAPNPAPLRDRAFRVSHMGSQTVEDVIQLAEALRALLPENTQASQ
jgi:aspartate aminotransferase-like enzyme